MIAAGTLPADVPRNFGHVTDAAQKEAQDRLAHLVPNATDITNTNSGHEIHKEQPRLVVDFNSRGCRRGAPREPADGALMAALSGGDGNEQGARRSTSAFCRWRIFSNYGVSLYFC